MPVKSGAVRRVTGEEPASSVSWTQWPCFAPAANGKLAFGVTSETVKL